MWTNFMDMCSGGYSKEPYRSITVAGGRKAAVAYFIKRFGHDPAKTTCKCCGEDYSISEYTALSKVPSTIGVSLIIGRKEVALL